jgi:hypothetical protein
MIERVNFIGHIYIDPDSADMRGMTLREYVDQLTGQSGHFIDDAEVDCCDCCTYDDCGKRRLQRKEFT